MICIQNAYNIGYHTNDCSTQRCCNVDAVCICMQLIDKHIDCSGGLVQLGVNHNRACATHALIASSRRCLTMQKLIHSRHAAAGDSVSKAEANPCGPVD